MSNVYPHRHITRTGWSAGRVGSGEGGGGGGVYWLFW